MVPAIQNTAIRIDDHWLNENQNEKVDQTFFTRFTEYTGKAIGALRSLQVIKGSAKLRNEIGRSPSSIATGLEGNTGVAISALGIVRLPSVTQDAVRAVVALNQDDGVSVDRKIGKAIRDTMDAVSAWVYASIFFTGNLAFLGVAKVSDLANDGADLTLSVADYGQAVQYETAASGDVKKAFTHTKNYNMLRIAKAIASFVSAILGVVFLLTGAQLFSVVALVALSITTALLAIRRDLYKEEGQYRVISFDRSLII